MSSLSQSVIKAAFPLRANTWLALTFPRTLNSAFNSLRSAATRLFIRIKTFILPHGLIIFPLLLARFTGQPSSIFELRFSPDSRYFVAGHYAASLAYDLKSQAEVRLPSRIHEMLQFTFAFVSPEEIAGVVGGGDFGKLVRARFPSGDKIDEFKLPAYGHLYSTSQSNYY